MPGQFKYICVNLTCRQCIVSSLYFRFSLASATKKVSWGNRALANILQNQERFFVVASCDHCVHYSTSQKSEFNDFFESNSLDENSVGKFLRDFAEMK